MRIGRLRHRVAFYSVTKAGGTASPVETLFGTFWAELRPQSGKEVQALGGTFATLTYKITMRFVHGIEPSMIAIFEGRRFKLKSVSDVDMRHDELQIVAEESK